MKKLSDRATRLPVSAALRVDLKTKELAAQGRDIISFCVGEPDGTSPREATESGISAIRENDTRYTNAPGTTELRQAVALRMTRHTGMEYEWRDIAVTTGGKYAVYAAVCALCDPGEEAVLPAPYWTSYYHILRLAGVTPRVVRTKLENGWEMTPEELEESITPQTKLVILNNPNNPSGAVYTKKELIALARVIRSHDLYVIADEIYDAYVYADEPFCPLASLDDDMRLRTVTVNGVSKAYAMTGWRIGWAACDRAIAGRIGAILSHTTGCPSAVSQRAALAALEKEPEGLSDLYRARRDALEEELRHVEGLAFTHADGAFYLMPVLTGELAKRFSSAEAFAMELLESAGVAVVPCEDYGVEMAFRMSYTMDIDQIREGARRLARFAAEKCL